ncbi:MAG: DNA-binding protein [Ornithinibacter sp.]
MPADAVPDRATAPHQVHAIGAPARRALTNADLTTWDAVDATSDADLLALHGFGPRALHLLREASAGRG